jgi:hypothetical protein
VNRLVCVGEGHGEVSALPRLCHAIRDYLGAWSWLVDPIAIRVPRSELVVTRQAGRPTVCNAAGVARVVELARRRPAKAVLVTCDSDDDCPAQWAASLDGVRTVAVGVGAVMIVREYETWLLWNQRQATLAAHGISNPESRRDAKGLLERVVEGYTPSTHQLELTRSIDVGHVRARSQSFDKLVRVLALVFSVSVPPHSP